MVLTDGTTWFTYRIDTKPYKTLPSDIAVIDPVPTKSGYTRAGPLSDADDLRAGMGPQPPADRLGAS